MNTVITLSLALIASAASLAACPDFSGHYLEQVCEGKEFLLPEFWSRADRELKIDQQGCEVITFSFNQHGKRRTETINLKKVDSLTIKDQTLIIKRTQPEAFSDSSYVPSIGTKSESETKSLSKQGNLMDFRRELTHRSVTNLIPAVVSHEGHCIYEKLDEAY